MSAQGPDRHVSPSVHLGRSDVHHRRDEERVHGRERQPASISRMGSDVFDEGSRKTTASSDNFFSVSNRTDNIVRGYERQHSVYGSGHTSSEGLNETHPQSRPSFIQRNLSAHGMVVHTSEPKASTVAQRLQPTLDVATEEKDKYVLKAKWTGWALNVAIGMQVLLGSLTTGLSAVAVSGGRSTAVSTTVLGALATMVASYLARARGSNEPELSIARVKDLEQFIRECEAFKMDHGHMIGDDFDDILKAKRNHFEELLGNANGERRLAPPV